MLLYEYLNHKGQVEMMRHSRMRRMQYSVLCSSTDCTLELQHGQSLNNAKKKTVQLAIITKKPEKFKRKTN